MLRKTFRVFLASLLLCGLVVGLAMLASKMAYSQGAPCASLSVIERALANLGEQMIAVGAADGKMVRFYVHPDKRTWTVVVVDGRGMACPIAAGTSLSFASPPTPGRDS